MPKIYASPVPAPAYDWSGDFREFQRLDDEHEQAVKKWLADNGYIGKNSGRIVRFGVADGHAAYMIAEGARKFFLIHLPYGDAYQYPDAQYLPKSEILRRADQADNLAKLFA